MAASTRTRRLRSRLPRYLRPEGTKEHARSEVHDEGRRAETNSDPERARRKVEEHSQSEKDNYCPCSGIGLMGSPSERHGCARRQTEADDIPMDLLWSHRSR